ncbi:DUF6443 domain-containing protein [Emticicia sp.]|uniref:DUF6443 domain-containing protein n=1 Tax=Emticicia sp. TaxID=1930953 RepID=UPI003BAC181C
MKRYIILLFFIPLLGFAQTIPSDKNAIIHSKFRVATTNEADGSDPSKAVITVAYSDGLGRGLQTVGYQQSPTNKDIVSGTVEFDKFGRVIRTALPAPTTNNTGTYQANAFSLANSFYGDSYAYTATTAFDNSPLNRVREQYGAGNAWRTANKKMQNFDESAGSDVRYYYLDGSGNIILSGTYPNNSLYKKRIIDEQGHTSIEISDKRGRLVQKQLQDNNGYATTYYLYDGMGRILAVIQPEGYELNSSITKNSTEWQRWIFSYEYDYRGRMHLKHVPASGDEYFVYDKWDRLVWSQSSIQREFGKWSFYKYDAFNREIMRGEKSENRGLTALEAETWAWSGDRYESRVSGGLFYSYSNSYPQLFSDTDIRHVNYYDNYNDWRPSGMAFADGGTAFHAQHPEAQSLMVGSRSRSDVSGNWLATVLYYDNKMRVIRTFSQNVYGQIEMLDTEYNHAGEILQTKKIHKNQAGIATTEQSQNELDHVGRVKKLFHGINTTPIEIVKNDYDEIGRVSQKKIFPNNTFVAGGTKEFIERPSQGIVTQPNTEDFARRYVLLLPTTDIKASALTKYRAEITPNASQGVNINGLQTMNYTWHLRGGLLGINLDNNGNAIPKASEGDLFSYKLEYESAGFYDGNIGKQYWQSANDQNQVIGLRSYNMTYDPLKRMTGANFAGLANENYSLSGLTYDKNGNIKTMQRNGKTSSGFGLMDNLNYAYDGNKLNQVTDGVSATDNEVDLVPRGGGNYTYYTDGSVKSDANEGISLIIYDTFLKQPKEVQLTDGRKINHFYDGAGALLKTVYSTGEYWEFGGITYKNGQPYQMAAPEGRAIYVNGVWVYEFFYTDHLGNTRVAFRADGNQLIKTSETAFDPFGVILRGAGQVNGVINRHEYQNKESEKTFGLNRINLGARTYNPTTGRMDRVDRFADKYFGLSTFQYSANNPMRFIDVNGDSLGINVIQGGGKNGRDLYQITITGKVVDNTTKGLSSKQLNSIANQISKQFINSFTGKDKNIEFTATANISVESATNPLSSSDHAFRIVDDVATAVGQQDPPGGNIEGYGPVGQNVVYIEKGGNYARTGTHELGHSSGLGHIKSLTEVQNGKIVPLTTNDYFGNLMHQGQDVNSQGQPVAGTSIEGFQVREMYRLYKIPALNRGKQK